MVTPNYRVVKKDRLFYNRFELCASFDLDEATALRTLSHEFIDDCIERRRQWRELYKTHWVTLHAKSQLVPRKQKEITDQAVKDLHTVCDFLTARPSESYKLVCNPSTVHVYTNDKDLIKHIGKLSCVGFVQYSRAVLDRPTDTVLLKKSQYHSRSYLKNIKLNQEQKKHLEQFLSAQQVRVSPALQEWLCSGLLRTQDYFFIDHSGESWLTMLSLVHSGLVRKTLKIQVA